jgi:hypothetical protein
MTEQNSVEISQTDGSYPHKTIATLSELATTHIGDSFGDVVEAVEAGDKIVLAWPLTGYGWISQGVYHLHIGHVDDPEDEQDGN